MTAVNEEEECEWFGIIRAWASMASIAAFASSRCVRAGQPARALIDDLRSRENLLGCNGCELTIGKELKADRLLIGWVQKVSNLILNINFRVEDVSTGAVVLQKSVDIPRQHGRLAAPRP